MSSSEFIVEETARRRWPFDVRYSGRTYARCMERSDADMIAAMLNAHRRKDRPLTQDESDAVARAIRQSR